MPMYHFLCTESMHLQSSLQCPLGCVCAAAPVDLLAYTYASVEIYYMYTAESRYKLRGGRILLQITPLQDFGAEVRGGLILRILRYQ